MANFEEKLVSLETVVERLERGELSLEESVKLFEEGMLLSGACRQELKAAEGRIEQLIELQENQRDGLDEGLTEKRFAASVLEVDTSLMDLEDADDER